jgi:hypothetical protein
VAGLLPEPRWRSGYFRAFTASSFVR